MTIAKSKIVFGVLFVIAQDVLVQRKPLNPKTLGRALSHHR
jgi:hypothetical protein